MIEFRKLEDFFLVFREVAKRHAPVTTPDPFPEFHEPTKGGRPVVIRLVEVQNDVLGIGPFQQVENVFSSSHNSLKIKLSQVRSWDDDDRVVLLLNLKDPFRRRQC